MSNREVIPAEKWGRNIQGQPTRLRLDNIQGLTVHYTGAPRVTATKSQVASLIKRTEVSHQNRPGSEKQATVAYNFFVDKYGRIWEGRGWAYRNAANGARRGEPSSNSTTISVCVLSGVQDNTPTPEITEALQRLYTLASSKTKRRLKVTGHRDHKATSCPGDELYKLVRSGVIESNTPVPVRPTVSNPMHLTVRRGNRGASVKSAQSLLTKHGFATTADGVFGPKTELSVRAFQKARGLTVDGVVGRKTWGALTGA